MTTPATPRPSPRFYYGWVIVAVVGLASFAQSAEAMPVLGVFLKPITEEFGWSRSLFTGALTIGTLLGGVLAIGIGPMIDRYGGRWILTIAITIVGTALILTSRINALWQFYLLQIVARMVGMGVVMLAIQVAIPKWFIAKRGRAVAIGQVGLTFGNVVTPLYAQLLVRVADWRAAAATAGAVMLALSILPTAILLRRSPEDMGLLPDGVSPESDVNGQHVSSAASKRPRSEVSLTVRQVVRLPSFYLLVLSFGMVMIAAPGMFLHLIAYLTDQDLSPGIAVTVMAVVAGSAALGSVGFGLLAERYSTRLLLSMDLVLMAGGYLFLLAANSPTLALLWGLYMGIVQGGIFTMQQVVLADYYGRESLGAVRGVVWPVQTTANAFGPLASALAYDINGSYGLIFGVFGLLGLLAALCVFLAKPPVLVGDQQDH
ncbi:MAG: MFS transporter [Chloroflexi bacterium]|nr:MFS transporter [Chloroflexota bacterium]